MSAPIRVAVVAGSYPPDFCGVADYTRRLVHALRDRGLAVEVYVRARGGAGPDETEPGVHRLAPGWGIGAVNGLLARAAPWRPAIVHLQYQTALFDKGLPIVFLPLWARRAMPGVRAVVTLHDLNGPRVLPRVPATGRPALRFLAARSDGVIVTNELDREAVEGWRLPPAGVRLVPVGPTILPAREEPGERPRLRASLGVADDEVLFVYFGLLMRDKGLDTLLAASRGLPAAGWKLLLLATTRTGREERRRAQLRARARAIGVADRLIWRERLGEADVSRHLRAADVGVLPFDEGLSTRRSSFAVLAAHGLPLVSTRPRRLPQALGAEAPALLVPPRDAAALALALEHLRCSPPDREAYARRSLAAAQHLSWESAARETEAFYRSVLGETEASSAPAAPAGAATGSSPGCGPDPL